MAKDIMVKYRFKVPKIGAEHSMDVHLINSYGASLTVAKSNPLSTELMKVSEWTVNELKMLVWSLCFSEGVHAVEVNPRKIKVIFEQQAGESARISIVQLLSMFEWMIDRSMTGPLSTPGIIYEFERGVLSANSVGTIFGDATMKQMKSLHSEQAATLLSSIFFTEHVLRISLQEESELIVDLDTPDIESVHVRIKSRINEILAPYGFRAHFRLSFAQPDEEVDNRNLR